MKQVSIGELATINPRAPRSVLDTPDQTVSFLAMSSVSEEGRIASEDERPVREVSKGYTYFERGDVLLAKITPCMENGKAAYLESLRNPIGFGSTEFHVLRPGPEVDGKYLFYSVWNPRFRFIAERNMTGSAGQKRVPADFLRRFPVPLPSLKEQKRIAATLDKADAIRRKRRQTIALIEDLLRSTFLEMFGDPVGNSHGYPTASLGELCSDVRYGTSVKCNADANEFALPVLRIPNVIGGRISWDELKYAVLSVGEVEKLSLSDGDILFVRTNGNPEYIGRCAVFQGQREALFASYLIRARPATGGLCVPEYLQACFSMPSYRSVLVKSARTTAGNYNISGSALKSLDVPLAPISLQKKYLRTIERIASVRASYIGARSYSEDLFGSLSQRAFRGEL